MAVTNLDKRMRKDGKPREKPWSAKARIRGTFEYPNPRDVYLGCFATREEAEEAVKAWYEAKYGAGSSN